MALQSPLPLALFITLLLGIGATFAEPEKEIVSILVSSDHQDAVFDAVHRAGDFGVPGDVPGETDL